MKEKEAKRIEIIRSGPYVVTGNIPLANESSVRDKKGVPVEWELLERYPDQEDYDLCRCGASKNKPFCDGSHHAIGFEGRETASRAPFSQVAERYEGSDFDLLDDEELCAGAQFCHRGQGIWELVDANDSKAKRMAAEIAGNCPTGRLVVCEKGTGKPIEPHFEKSITVLEDPGRGCSGPLWVKGGIPIQSADGSEYEVRNRATLCRCGKSSNKPFCDGTHISIHFKDDR